MQNQQSGQHDTVEPTLSKRQTRNAFRGKQNRSKQSTAVDTANKDDIYKKLLFGFKNINDALLSLQTVTVPRSVFLPITTRAIGFVTRTLITKFQRVGLNLDFHRLCGAMYRIHLLMLEIKIMQAAANQTSIFATPIIYRSCDVDSSFVRAIGEMGAGFGPLLNIVQSIGVFKGFGCEYIPKLVNQVGLEPVTVNFDQLRVNVQLLALEATPVEKRKYFYDHCPFPNAKWKVRSAQKRKAADPCTSMDADPGHDEPGVEGPVLENPDDIMPEHYGLDQLREDISLLNTAIDVIARKYPKYIHMGRVDFNSNGSTSQLVSSSVGTIQCCPLGANMYKDMPFRGSNDDYYSSELLSDPEFYLGMLHLNGELPAVPTIEWGPRLISSAKQMSNGDFCSCLENLVG